jgi:hypothetical protein
MLIYGKHARFDLAERHAQRLAKQNPGTEVRILSRRNKAGRFAANGRHFTFEIKARTGAVPPSKAALKAPLKAAAPKKEIGSLKDFFDAFDEADEFDNYDIDGGVDYGE